MVSVDADISSLLIRCLSAVLRVDPVIVYTSSAMELLFHFVVAVPENPIARSDLPDVLEFMMPKLWIEAANQQKSDLGEESYQWLAKATEIINLAAQRAKGDPLIEVWPLHKAYQLSLAILTEFLCGWKGPLPSGIVGVIFPTLAGILIPADDVVVLRVFPRWMS